MKVGREGEESTAVTNVLVFESSVCLSFWTSMGFSYDIVHESPIRRKPVCTGNATATGQDAGQSEEIPTVSSFVPFYDSP